MKTEEQRKWLRERDKALIAAVMNHDYKLMDSFMMKNGTPQFVTASETVKLATACKCVCNMAVVRTDVKQKALDTLKELKMSPNIF